MTGSEFQAWLETENTDTRRRVEEANKYVKWGSEIYKQELVKVARDKETAHKERVAQIIEYCEVQS
jgi:hypothetical protein